MNRAKGHEKRALARGHWHFTFLISIRYPLQSPALLSSSPPMPAVDLRPYAHFGQLYKGSKRARAARRHHHPSSFTTESAFSMDTYVRWEIVFVICGRPKTALSLLCERHKLSVGRKSLTENRYPRSWQTLYTERE